MKQPTDTGTNRTGVGTAPRLSKEMEEGARGYSPNGSFDQWQNTTLRRAYVEDAEPVGTMPPPSTLRGAATTGMKMLQGEKATVLLDKLGERLAFERTGTRLYDAFLRKLDAWQPVPGGPTGPEVREIRDEEKRHFVLVHRAMTTLGADPTAMTPCANVAMVASKGVPEVLGDPRTDLPQCLAALLQAELTDTAGWELLVSLAESMGQDAMAEDFRVALANEERHVARVREWLATVVSAQAVGDGAETQPRA